MNNYFLNDNKIDYNNLNYKNDDIFDPLLINQKFLNLYKKMKNDNLTDNLRFKK